MLVLVVHCEWGHFGIVVSCGFLPEIEEALGLEKWKNRKVVVVFLAEETGQFGVGFVVVSAGYLGIRWLF